MKIETSLFGVSYLVSVAQPRRSHLHIEGQLRRIRFLCIGFPCLLLGELVSCCSLGTATCITFQSLHRRPAQCAFSVCASSEGLVRCRIRGAATCTASTACITSSVALCPCHGLHCEGLRVEWRAAQLRGFLCDERQRERETLRDLAGACFLGGSPCSPAKVTPWVPGSSLVLEGGLFYRFICLDYVFSPALVVCTLCALCCFSRAPLSQFLVEVQSRRNFAKFKTLSLNLVYACCIDLFCTPRTHISVVPFSRVFFTLVTHYGIHPGRAEPAKFHENWSFLLTARVD